MYPESTSMLLMYPESTGMLLFRLHDADKANGKNW
jgi:hypothetical protein